MKKIVMVRHAQSQWNLENRFTGWHDVDLTDKGVEEAHEAGKLLRKEGYTFDVAYNIIGGGEEGEKTDIRTKEQADHSLPYMLAAA